MVQGVGENPERAGGRRNLGPLLDNLGWDPNETGNLQKSTGSGRHCWLPLHTATTSSKNRNLTNEETRCIITGLKSCSRAAYVFVLSAMDFLITKLY